MTIKIEKGVPMPPRRSGERKYPWRDMDVGDSFYVENMSQGVLSPSAAAAGKRLGRKFSVRKDGAGMRVWRIA